MIVTRIVTNNSRKIVGGPFAGNSIYIRQKGRMDEGDSNVGIEACDSLSDGDHDRITISKLSRVAMRVYALVSPH